MAYTTLQHREWLLTTYEACRVVARIPRRLGAEASREELALDKERARALGHRAGSEFLRWGGSRLPEWNGPVLGGGVGAGPVDWQVLLGEWLARLDRLGASYAELPPSERRYRIKMENKLHWRRAELLQLAARLKLLDEHAPDP